MDIKNKDVVLFYVGIIIVGLLSVGSFCNGLFVRSLLLDEALFARNIAIFPAGFFISSAAPAAPLFYVSTWGLIQLIGDFEWVYKLIPVLTSILSLYLLFNYLNKRFSKVITFFCFVLFAFSAPFIHYASNAHPYATDLFFCLLLFISSESLIRQFNFKTLILWTLYSVLALMSSFPAFFFVPAFGLIISIYHWRTFSGEINFKLLFSFILLFIIMLCLYLVFYKKMAAAHVNMFNYAFVSQTSGVIRPIALFKHFFNKTHLMMGYFFWNYQSGIIGVFLAVLGIVHYLNEKKYSVLWLLASLSAVIVIANLAQRWPIGPWRSMLFVMPLIIVLFAGALSLIWNIARTKMTQFVIVLAFVSLIVPEAWIVKSAFIQVTDSEEAMRSLRGAILAEIEENDTFIVTCTAVPQFRYYFKDYLNRASLHSWDIHGNELLIEKEITRVMQNKPGRYWLILSHYKEEFYEFVMQVASQHAIQLDDFQFSGCRAVLLQVNEN